MRSRVREKKKTRGNRLSGLLIAAGLLVVLYTVFGQLRAVYIQKKTYEDLLKYTAQLASEVTPPEGVDPPEPLPPQTDLGILAIPKLEIYARIAEGVEEDQLYYGVGHHKETAIPGEIGNAVLAGHRTSYRMHPFKELDEVEIGDVIEIVTPKKTFTFSVFDTFIVDYNDRSILKQGQDEAILTLYTCHPEGSLEYRLVVQARLVED